MIISNFSVYQYKLPLNSPVTIKGKTIETREGFIVGLSVNGTTGYGEIAPLVNFNRESLEQVTRQLKKATEFFRHRPLLNNAEKLDGHLHNWLKPLEFSPSVQFGIEMAVLNLVANLRKKTLHQIISTESHELIRLSGLIQGTKADVITQAKKRLEEGYRVIKMKVGGKVNEDVEKVQAVNEVIYEKAVLHVDANQQWKVEEATEFAEAIGPAAIDYIEEPFADTNQIPEFFDRTLIPVALDESVSRIPFEEIRHISGVDIVVLKPTVLGGIEKTWQIMQQAKNQAILPVISSSYESSIGILTLANMCGSLARDNEAGLDTMRTFKKDLLKEPLQINHGKLDISQRRIETDSINFDLLEQI